VSLCGLIFAVSLGGAVSQWAVCTPWRIEFFVRILGRDNLMNALPHRCHRRRIKAIPHLGGGSCHGSVLNGTLPWAQERLGPLKSEGACKPDSCKLYGLS
jgi:hypothetical protein